MYSLLKEAKIPSMALSSDQFYTLLEKNELPVHEVLGQESLFHHIPDDWVVVITDIKGSTKAVEEGKHPLVNLVATGSIIAALNIARKAELSIPFFFGGDGATLILPPSLIKPVMLALTEHQENTAKNFGLDLRVGNIPVAKIYENSSKLKVSKANMNPIYTIPVILGEGLKYAEQLIKAKDYQPEPISISQESLDLEGMECRWDKIRPPKNNFEVVCLLVEARDEDRQASIFKAVLDQIEQVYGSQQIRQPISTRQLRLQATIKRIQTEMKVKLGSFQFAYLIENWLKTLYGKLFFKIDRSGKAYLDNLVKLSDTLVMDGRINTVISGNSEQRNLLIQELEKIEQQGDILFGIHASEESVMSCYVRDRKDQHIHFIDGSGGGYTQAANMLKKKIRALKP